MKLLIIRHGDPDYRIDSLTEKGWKEVEYLAERLSTLDVKDFYVSPLGRAKDTAGCTLRKMGRSAEECLWLREFEAPIEKPNLPGQKSIAWDWLPTDWTKEERFYQPDAWYDVEPMRAGNVKAAYDWVTGNFDALLEEHGYARMGNCYRVVSPNNDTLVFFCHFGVQCVLLSHLLHISPMPLWHGTCAAPSSVTTVVTEERQEGTAIFRISAFGDTSHLFAHNEPPAFSGKFRECFINENEKDWC